MKINLNFPLTSAKRIKHMEKYFLYFIIYILFIISISEAMVLTNFLHINNLYQIYKYKIYSPSSSRWIQAEKTYPKDPKEQKDIDNILKNEIGITDNDTSLAKSVKISSYLFPIIDDKRGFPDKRFNDFYQMWIEANKNTSDLWCSQFSAIYIMFANSANIPSRLVHTSSMHEGREEQHTVAESYIAELDKWIMIDLTHNQLYLKDKSGKILNTYEAVKKYSKRNRKGHPSLWNQDLSMMNPQTEEVKINADLEDLLKNKLDLQHMYFNETTSIIYTQYQPGGTLILEM